MYKNILLNGYINNFNDNDLLYQKKLEVSYKKCLKELCNYEELEDQLNKIKYNVDPETGKQIKSYIFDLNYEDKIIVKDINHSYIFKRSKFYSSFDKPKSYLKTDLINYWGKRNYYVRLVYLNFKNKWGLQLSWK